MTQVQKPLRVLHVVGSMTRAGIETWLMNVLRRIDRTAISMDFLVHTTEPAHYDEEIRSMGSQIFRIRAPKRSFPYIGALNEALAESGPADILHVHEHYLSGLILAVASRQQFPFRIVHCHNDTSSQESVRHPLRLSMAAIMRMLIRRNASLGLVCSPHCGPCLFGRDWQRRPGVSVLYYGIDFDEFRVSGNPRAYRERLGLPPDAVIVTNIGRLEHQKNQDLILNMARELKDSPRTYHFLLVGDGSCRERLSSRVQKEGLSGRVTLLGNRPDIAEILALATDLFLFPSWHEGLGLALIEAQAAGVPTIHSSVIPPEANIIKSASIRLHPAAPVSSWCNALEQAMSLRPIASSDTRWSLLESSPFSIARSVRSLLDIYATAGVSAGMYAPSSAMAPWRTSNGGATSAEDCQ